MYYAIEALEITDQSIEGDSFNDLEAQAPRLFEDIYSFIHHSLAPQCDASFLQPLIAQIEHLEEMLNDELSHHRMTPLQVEQGKNQLLVLLQLIQRQISDIDGATEQRGLDRELTNYRRAFLSSVGRQQNIIQRAFCLTTPESEARCDQIGKILLGIYASLGGIFLVSMIALFVNDGRNHLIRDVFSWALVLTIIPISIPMYLFFAAYLAITFCDPCIDYYRAHIPENPNTIQGQTIATTLFGIFQQHKQRILDDFRRNPNLRPKNIRDIALKLWLSYINTTELLSSKAIQPVLEEYAQHLDDTRNQSFEQVVENDFANRLLTFYVEPGRQQLKSAILSSDDVTQETTLSDAIKVVKEIRAANIASGDINFNNNFIRC
jgi:hypothetical protein